MPTLRLFTTLLALCATLPAFAAPAPTLEPITLEQAQAKPARREYLKWLSNAEAEVAKAAQANAAGDLRSGQGYNLMEGLATMQSYAGEVDAAMKAYDLRSNARKPRVPLVSEAGLDGLKAEEAVQAIVAAAKDRRIVLINEAHHVPLHRAFTMKLARELRKAGFTTFAAETLSRDGVGMPGRGVGVDDGAYVKEPQYAELLRDVGRDGWQVVAYESMETPDGPANGMAAIQHREMVQARNLVEKVLQPHPEAKLLVHVGYFHLDKRPGGNTGGLKLMGTLLRELSGIEPLSVDQTSLMSHDDPNQEWAPYRQLLAATDLKVASVLRKADGTPLILGQAPGAIDMQVIHPPYGADHGRPAWLATVAGRASVDVPPVLRPTARRRLVYAFYADDTRLDAVPVDTVLLRPGEVPALLMLPAGRFRLEIED